MKKYILLLFVILLHLNTSAFTLLKAVASGNWGDAVTWTPGRAPAAGDSIVIPASFTITVDDQYDYSGAASAIKVNILGVLVFANGKKLKLPCNSELWVDVGAQIIGGGGGGSSNLIDVCATTVWDASNGTVNGPQYLSTTSVMPIELNTFYALPQNKKVMLNWQTATETNNRDFTVERSEDGTTYSALSVIPSKAPRGNSIAPINYEFLDPKPLEGTSYYRFKQTDYNGRYKYFQVISVDIEKSKQVTFTVYPNPNQGQFTVDFTGIENNHEIEVTMFDQHGKTAYSKLILSESLATNTFSIIPENKIASGMYMVSFVVEGVKYPVKVIVQ